VKHTINSYLSVTTPEGVRLLLTPAGPVPRAWAWLIDTCLWGMVMIALALVLLQSKLGQGIFAVLLFASFWGYPIICEVYFSGKTIGKRIMGIEVLRVDGLPVGWRESTLRNLLLVADFLPAAYASGLLFMLLGQHFRRIGDIVAGTQVVYSEKATPRKSPEGVAPIPLPYPLNPEQQRALIGLFEREAGLPVARMQELGTVAQPLTGLTGQASVDRLRGYAASLTQ
jgi:uncharacterized RDD family membrane protein YckC